VLGGLAVDEVDGRAVRGVHGQVVQPGPHAVVGQSGTQGRGLLDDQIRLTDAPAPALGLRTRCR